MLKSFCQGEITPHRLKKRSMQRIVLLKFGFIRKKVEKQKIHH